ncbi:uncharacterized protein TRIADDRAFT_54587 [Trichoplax adhaerens]|uniref:PDZ domain-containing protein n=1 Tax=Trichoplax adhaerens TaxID=10228 RepID=B3RSG4_TRIAD|nr:predicted protein [Trichoplax adhaerens]EDV26511.1 predicted protein [Trichoplax adhaerens]|eukprot:XP_002110507.1 predicted protein [Trichoplax adhaerens]
MALSSDRAQITLFLLAQLRPVVAENLQSYGTDYLDNVDISIKSLASYLQSIGFNQKDQLDYNRLITYGFLPTKIPKLSDLDFAVDIAIVYIQKCQHHLIQPFNLACTPETSVDGITRKYYVKQINDINLQGQLYLEDEVLAINGHAICHILPSKAIWFINNSLRYGITTLTVARPFSANSIQTNLDTMVGLAYSIVHSNSLNSCIGRLQEELLSQSSVKTKTTWSIEKMHIMVDSDGLGITLYTDDIRPGIYIATIQGAAAKDGRLKEHDRLLAINGKCLLALTHDEAHACVQQGAQENNGSVMQLIIASQKTVIDEEPYANVKNGRIVLPDKQKPSLLHNENILNETINVDQDDYIYHNNDINDDTSIGQLPTFALEVIQDSFQTQSSEIQNANSAASDGNDSTEPSNIQAGNQDDMPQVPVQIITSSSDLEAIPSISPIQDQIGDQKEIIDDAEYVIEEVILQKVENVSLGIGVGLLADLDANEKGKYNQGIFIQHLKKGSQGMECGKLHRGDQIVEVNGTSLIGVTLSQAYGILGQLKPGNVVMITRHHQDPKISEQFMDKTLKALESKGKSGWRLSEDEKEPHRLNRSSSYRDVSNTDADEPQSRSRTHTLSIVSRSPVAIAKNFLRPKPLEPLNSNEISSPDVDTLLVNSESSKDHLIEVVQLRNDVAETIGMQLHVRNESVNTFNADGESVVKTYNRVFIASVAKDGAAARAIGGSGSLRADDEILEVDGKVLKDLSPESLQATFREMPSVVSMKIKRMLALSNKQDPLRRSVKPPEKPNRNSMIFDDGQLQLSDSGTNRTRGSSSINIPNVIESLEEVSQVTDLTTPDHIQSHNDDSTASPSSVILDGTLGSRYDDNLDMITGQEHNERADSQLISDPVRNGLLEQVINDKAISPGRDHQSDDQLLNNQATPGALSTSTGAETKKKRKGKFWRRKSAADIKVSVDNEDVSIFIGNDQYRLLSSIPRGRKIDEPYHIILQKTRSKGLGLKLELDLASQSFKIVKYRSTGTINKKEDLTVGDLALNINNQNLVGKTSSEIERILKSLPYGPVTIVAETAHSWAKRAADLMRLSTSMLNAPSSSAIETPKSGSEELTVLSVQIDKSDAAIFGVTVEEGYHMDTSYIYIKDIEPGSPAGCSNKFLLGDRIISINNQSTVGVSAEEAEVILASSSGIIDMVIHRLPRSKSITDSAGTGISRDVIKVEDIQLEQKDSPDGNINVQESMQQALQHAQSHNDQSKDEETKPDGFKSLLNPGDTYHRVKIRREGNTYGFSVASRISDRAVIVRKVTPGSLLDQTGNVKFGDRILAVDGIKITEGSDQTVQILKSSTKAVELHIARPAMTGHKASSSSSFAISQSRRRKSSGNSYTGSIELKPDGQKALNNSISRSIVTPQERDKQKLLNNVESAVTNPQVDQQISLSNPNSVASVPQIDTLSHCKVVKINKTAAGLGFSVGVIGKGCDSTVVIKSILPYGAASQSGNIESGDDLLEVNGLPMQGLPYNEVTNVLKSTPPGVVVLKIRHTNNEAI